jgi:hypothetical protein
MAIRRDFHVTVTPTVPTWELKTYGTVIHACRDRNEAIRQAREDFRAAWQDYGHAPAIYRARLATPKEVHEHERDF